MCGLVSLALHPAVDSVLAGPHLSPDLLMERITILGSGSMSTACAVLLASPPDKRVTLWGRDAGHMEQMSRTRENMRLLPGVRIPESVRLTHCAEDACSEADCYVVGIPTSFLREALGRLRPHLAPGVPVVSLVKGIENDTLLRPSQILEAELPGRHVVALSGPSHAEEVARRMPSSVVVAGHDMPLLKQVQQLFSTDRFRVYTNSDIVGVELGGAVKNVIAIAAGICDGLGYGDNAKAALMTRGIAEMTRFGVRFGALEKTFSGLAGLGDLMTTCFSPICAVAKATFSGSAASRGSGLPVATLQNEQARVQMPPRIMNVACFWLQHSPMLGQLASSQTVWSFRSRTNSFVWW